MSKPTGINHSTLSWVKKELDETLRQAAEALEQYSQDSSDPTQLQFCGTHLHQVHGILQLLELFGAAMLVEEMEQVVDALLKGEVQQTADAQQALMQAILQLGDYLERVQSGLQDIPILLLPLLNDLRAGRGANLLTEHSLFTPDLDAAQGRPDRPRGDGGDLPAVARKQRAVYQRGLLGFLRERNVANSLEQMQAALDALESATADDHVGSIWWIAAGLVDALQDGSVETAAAVKMLLGQVDRQIRRAADGGETALAAEPPRELVKNMLYYVARAESAAERVQAIQTQYRLKELLLDESELDAARQGMSGPNADILHSVGAALKEDLTVAKDSLDLFARSGYADRDRLAPLGAGLNRVADTLGVLGLGVPRRVVKELAERIQALAEGTVDADEATLLQIAEALLYVESAIDGLTAVTPGQQADAAEDAPDLSGTQVRELSEAEYQQVYGTAIAEAIAELAQIKDAIVKFLEAGQADDASGLGQRFTYLAGVLRLLDKSNVATALEAAGRYVAARLVPGAQMPATAELDALADAIAGIEYYLEQARDGHPHPDAVLEQAVAALASTGLDAADGDPAPVEAPAASASEDFEPADVEFSIEPLDVDVPTPEPEPVAAEPAVVEVKPVEPPPAAPAKKSNRINYDVPVMADTVDQDILEIFIEEAGEVLETLREQFPLWRGNPDDTEALTTVRRMLHTLKGSGRLAGALLLGEAAWTLESLLNRVLDRTLAPSTEIYDIIESGIDLLPGLIAQIQSGAAPDQDVLALMRRAERLANPGLPEEPAAASPAVPRSTAPAPEPLPAEAPLTLEDLEFDAPLPEEPAASGIENDWPVLETEPAAEELDIELTAIDVASDAPVEPEPAVPAMDPVLYDIFSRETADHLAVVQGFIAQGRANGGQAQAHEPLVRALHTLTGSARMADVVPIARLGRRLEVLAERHLVAERPFQADGLALLEQGATLIQELVAGLASPAPQWPDVEPLLEAIDAASDAVEGGRHSPLSVLIEADDDGADSTDEAPSEPVASADPELSPLADEAPLEIELEPAPEAVTEIELAPLPEPEPDVPALDAGPELTPIAAPELAPEPAQPAPAADAGEVDFDLVALFLEEAEDILQFLEGTVQRWEDEPDHDATVAELHRSLHTLKGGARLAGFNGIGTLCHALESISGDVAAHKVPADDVFFNLLHASLDRLVAMLEEAKQGRSPETPADLLQAIADMHGSTATVEEVEAAIEQSPADSELVEVFLEEAADILDTTEAALSRWRSEPDDGALIVELQRALHTLKGGARMAGFKLIGDLSHAMETLLVGVQMGAPRVSPALFDLLDRVYDRLFGLRAKAAAGAALGDVSDLLVAIDALRTAAPADEPMAAPPERAAPDIAPQSEPAAPEASVQPEPAAPQAEAPELESDSVAQPPLQAEPEPEPELEQPQPAAPAAHERQSAAPESQPAQAAPEPVPPAAARPAAARDAGATEEMRPAREEGAAQSDVIRVRADLLDNLVNFAGEVSIYRARLEQQLGAMRFNLGELDQTVARLREQLRTMEIETEAQMLYRFEREYEAENSGREDFDPLELDRFSRMQELSRALVESANDLVSIQNLLEYLSRESETLLLQQSRVNTELQDGLMRTRMVPFANLVPRMRRIVRQTCHELDKRAQLKVIGAEGEMDRTVLERVTAPLEHMLRNAIAHGIEDPARRRQAAKPDEGTITVALSREGADVVIRVSDDGGGINLEAIRRKAIAKGLMTADAPLGDREVMQFILESGFSTAEKVTQIAGRGVGMDVVASEIKQLGGTLEIDSAPNAGTTFTVRLPFTLAVNQALLCQAGEDVYAIPLSSIEGVVRMTHEELAHCFAHPHAAYYDYAGDRYEVRSLAVMLGVGEPLLPGPGKRAPIILVQTGDHHVAIQVDDLIGNREIVVKSVGAQISTVPGIYGATILADGRVVLILDVSTLIRLVMTTQQQVEPTAPAAAPETERKTTIMVVDDSITMRKVATRLLERNGMAVVTAKDGVDAVARLQEVVPDAMLLDIEMPRMDGYELATHIRNEKRLQHIPIIMITSRTGDKHRQRAMDIGVNRYLGKPYQESELLENLRELLEEARDGV